MYPNLFGISFIHMYGLCIGIGIIIADWFLHFAGKKANLPEKFLSWAETVGLLCVGVGVLSSMIFQSFYNYLETGVFEFGTSMTFYGGLIGGLITFCIAYFGYGRKRYKKYVPDILNIAACSVLIGHSFGRIGCFCSGCCYGKPTDSWLGVTFPGIGKVYPTQLFESLFLLILFLVLAFLVLKKNFKYSMSVYLIGYGVFRFFIEYIRGDDRGSFIGTALSPSQFWALLLPLVGIAYFFISKYFFKKLRSSEINNEILDEIATIEDIK